MEVVGRFDRFAVVREPRAKDGARRLLNHPYRFAELPKWWAQLMMCLAIDEDGTPCWVFAHDDDDENDSSSYRRDVRGWQSLSHPLLPRVIGTGKAHGMRWFATDVVFGAPLPVVIERCGDGAVDPSLLVSLLFDFASALQHVIDRRAFLTDLIVFDGTVDLQGRVHIHTRVSAEEGNVERRKLMQDAMLTNVAQWLDQLGKKGRAVNDPLPELVKNALRHLREADAAECVHLVEQYVDLVEARMHVAGLLASSMGEERKILVDWLDDAKGIDRAAVERAPAVLPDKPVRRPPGQWYMPTSIA